MKTSSRTKFAVVCTTAEGRELRKVSFLGCWTSYPVVGMPLADAVACRDDHAGRGTTSTYSVIDMEFEGAQSLFASEAKKAYLENCGYNALPYSERSQMEGRAREMRMVAIEVYKRAKSEFLARYIRECYCVEGSV